MTSAATPPGRPDAASICECFNVADGGTIVPDVRSVSRLTYLAGLLQSAPKGITHGPQHAALRDAVRSLLVVLPGMIAGAEAEAAAAAREGRTTEMEHFASRARALLDAAQPFAAVAARRRDQRGWWHGWARLIAAQVQNVLRQHDRPAGIKATSRTVEITCKILAKAGHAADPEAVVEALRDRDRKDG